MFRLNDSEKCQPFTKRKGCLRRQSTITSNEHHVFYERWKNTKSQISIRRRSYRIQNLIWTCRGPVRQDWGQNIHAANVIQPTSSITEVRLFKARSEATNVVKNQIAKFNIMWEDVGLLVTRTQYENSWKNIPKGFEEYCASIEIDF